MNAVYEDAVLGCIDRCLNWYTVLVSQTKIGIHVLWCKMRFKCSQVVYLTYMPSLVEAYADGACFHNNGTRRPIGGIGVYVTDGHVENIGRNVRDGRITNQNMELLAAMIGLQALDRMWIPGDTTILYTDSIYVMNCMTKWIKIWEVNGWMTKNKRPVQNGDILRAMLPIMKRCAVLFERVAPYERFSEEDIVKDRHLVGNRGAALLAMQAATDGSRSGCYIKRGLSLNSDELLSG